MIGLAIRSLRHRRTAFLSTFVAVFLGTVLVGSFTTLLGTATGPVSAQDRESLLIMGAVVGSWGALIVLISLVSTVGITIGQREAEVSLLQAVGATSSQMRRLVQAEVLAGCLVAATLGALVASQTGRLLLQGLRDAGLVGTSVGYRGVVESLTLTVVGVLAVCLAAATVAGQRSTLVLVATLPARSTAGQGQGARGNRSRPRLPRWRLAAGLALIACGLGGSVVTLTVTRHSDDPYLAMMTSGSNAILVGAGLAALAPVLLSALQPLRPVLGRGPVGHLAGWNTTRRAHHFAGVLGPTIMLAAVSVGTLLLTGIDTRTAVGVPDDVMDTITLLNSTVAAMLCLFAAIMVVNGYASAMAYRRPELQRLWQLGATRAQLRHLVTLEALVVGVTGAVLGLLASLTTVVPFSVARGEGLIPDGGLGLAAALTAATVAATLLSARGTIGRVAAT